mmetsp:Transcript_57499/g.186564  ORF Transcript_57499/g.186564 Transcript_57499/m.186564 type:complete len:879 (+) Transcript_57499:275-2911(+)
MVAFVADSGSSRSTTSIPSHAEAVPMVLCSGSGPAPVTMRADAEALTFIVSESSWAAPSVCGRWPTSQVGEACECRGEGRPWKARRVDCVPTLLAQTPELASSSSRMSLLSPCWSSTDEASLDDALAASARADMARLGISMSPQPSDACCPSARVATTMPTPQARRRTSFVADASSDDWIVHIAPSPAWKAPSLGTSFSSDVAGMVQVQTPEPAGKQQSRMPQQGKPTCLDDAAWSVVMQTPRPGVKRLPPRTQASTPISGRGSRIALQSRSVAGISTHHKPCAEPHRVRKKCLNKSIAIRAWHAKRRALKAFDSTECRYACERCGFVGHSRLSLSMHIVQSHRPRVDLKPSSRCAQAEIYKKLKLLTPEARRTMLTRSFSQAQRLDMEDWIRSQQRQQDPCSLGSACATPSQNRARRLALNEGCDLGRGANSRKRGPKSGCPGVYSRVHRGSTLYLAAGSAGSFRLFARPVHSLATARHFRSVLLAIRHRITQATTAVSVDAAPDAAVAEFARAVLEEPARFHLHADGDMGLRFAVVVSAGYWVGTQLLSPRYAASDLQVGLSAWCRLSDARCLVFSGSTNRYSILRRHSPHELTVAWQRLRAAYVSVWAEAGKDPDKVEERLDLLEGRHSAHRRRLLERWSTMQIAMSERAPAPASVPHRAGERAPEVSCALAFATPGCEVPGTASSRASRACGGAEVIAKVFDLGACSDRMLGIGSDTDHSCSRVAEATFCFAPKLEHSEPRTANPEDDSFHCLDRGLRGSAQGNCRSLTSSADWFGGKSGLGVGDCGRKSRTPAVAGTVAAHLSRWCAAGHAKLEPTACSTSVVSCSVTSQASREINVLLRSWAHRAARQLHSTALLTNSSLAIAVPVGRQVAA